MRISDLIAKLEEVRQEHGEVLVGLKYTDVDGNYETVDDVNVEYYLQEKLVYLTQAERLDFWSCIKQEMERQD